MSNLTIERGVLKRLGRADPVPNHDLVVYEVVGQGKRIRDVIREDGEVKRSWLERLRLKEEPFAYAVSRDRNLRHDFHVSCTSRDEIEEVTLHILFHFQVANPQTVVECLESDPVKRLEKETTSLAQRAIAKIPWAEIEARTVDLEHVVLMDKAVNGDETHVSNREIIEEFAEAVGLQLNHVRVSSSLPRKVADPERMALDTFRDREKERIRHLVDMENEEREAELEYARASNKADREILATRTEVTKQLAQRTVGAVGNAMDHVAANIDSVPTWRGAVREIQAFQATGVRELTIGRGDIAAGRQLSASAESSDVTTHGFRKLIHEFLRLTEAVTCDTAEQRQRLTSKGLHIIAEALLLDDADEDRLKGWVKELSEDFISLVEVGALGSPKHREILTLLQSPPKLQEELKKELCHGR